MLGAGTLLAPAGASSRDIAIDTADPSLLALLTAAHRRTPTVSALRHLGKAAERWRVGDDAMAAFHLTLSRLDRLGRADADAHRLFLADGLLRAGLEPEVLVKALDLGERDDLARYSPDQPRVPAGSGRSSGEWTAGSGGGDPAPRTPLRPSQAKPELGAARPSAGASPAIVGAAIGVGKAETSLDLGAMTARGLSGLAAFVAGLADVSAVAAGLGLAAGAGVLLIPSAGPRGKWVQVGGQGDLSYFFSPDEPGITFRYTTADGVQRTWSAGPEGPDHGYRGPDGRIIARWVKTAGKVALVVSTAALVGPRADEPQVCPAPSPDKGGPLGRRYEDFVKVQFNPGNPTPSGLAYEFFDPRERQVPKNRRLQMAGGPCGRPPVRGRCVGRVQRPRICRTPAQERHPMAAGHAGPTFRTGA